MTTLYRVLAVFLTLVCAALAQTSGEPGYFTDFSSMPKNDSISFGRNYAVLNLDIINDVTEPIANTTSGATWLECLQTWNDAVHALNPTPLTFWTRIYFENAHYPDVKQGSPFANSLLSSGIVAGPGTGNPNSTVQNSQLEASPLTEIYSAFNPQVGSDIVLQKTRFYAGFGNNMENILAAQSIDTVILVSIELDYMFSK